MHLLNLLELNFMSILTLRFFKIVADGVFGEMMKVSLCHSIFVYGVCVVC